MGYIERLAAGLTEEEAQDMTAEYPAMNYGTTVANGQDRVALLESAAQRLDVDTGSRQRLAGGALGAQHAQEQAAAADAPAAQPDGLAQRELQGLLRVRGERDVARPAPGPVQCTGCSPSILWNNWPLP